MKQKKKRQRKVGGKGAETGLVNSALQYDATKKRVKDKERERWMDEDTVFSNASRRLESPHSIQRYNILSYVGDTQLRRPSPSVRSVEGYCRLHKLCR